MMTSHLFIWFNSDFLAPLQDHIKNGYISVEKQNIGIEKNAQKCYIK